jgi:hypothetical protein
MMPVMPPLCLIGHLGSKSTKTGKFKDDAREKEEKVSTEARCVCFTLFATQTAAGD